MGRKLTLAVSGIAAVTIAIAALTARSGQMLIQTGYGTVQPINVNSGPVWLAKLLYAPPPWFPIALTALIGVILAVSVRSYRRIHVDERPDVVSNMALNAMIMLLVAGSAYALKGFGTSWVLIVGISPLFGYVAGAIIWSWAGHNAVIHAMDSVADDSISPDRGLDEERDRMNTEEIDRDTA